AAVAAGLALAGEAHARAVLDPRRDVHAVLAHGAHDARARAGRARVLDHRPAAAAALARLRDREQALALGLDAAALAARADRRAGAGLGAGAVARGAAPARRHRQRDLRPLGRLLEAHRDLDLLVVAALGPRLARAAAGAD